MAAGLFYTLRMQGSGGVGDIEARKRLIKEQLQQLSNDRGLWRPDIGEFLVRQLPQLRDALDLRGVSDDEVRELASQRLNLHIAAIPPRRHNQSLREAARRSQFRLAVSAGFNSAARHPELRTMNLTRRQAWLTDESPEKIQSPSARSARRDLEYAIDRIAEILADQVLVGVAHRGGDAPAEQHEALTADAPASSADDEALRASTPQSIAAQLKRPRVLYPSVLLLALILVTSVLKVVTDQNSDSATESPHAAVAGPNCENGFCVTRDWPVLRGCDGATSVAMGPGKDDFASMYAGKATSSEFRIAVANADGGGSWKSGHLYMLMASSDGTPVTIQNIVQRIEPTRLPPPAWVFTPSGDCGDTYSRVYQLDLDNDSFVDLGLKGESDSSDGGPPPTEPLGPAFTVTDREPALVRVDVISCNDNYSWTLDITFVRNGKSETRTIGPYRSMGRAENAKLYEIDPYTGKLAAGVKRFSSSANDKC